jgi:3-oxoacyl-[acyl-carrier protein] reductase
MGLLDGKVSLVTGASRGIGRAIAAALASEGAHVVAAARDEARLAELVREVVGRGGRAEALGLDVTDRASVEAAMERVLGGHGRLDHVVNNAGVTRDNLLLRMKDEEWQQVLATNLTGVFLCTQAALRPMLKQRSGRIVSITSVVGLGGNAGQANYAASKAGIVGFTRSVAREVASRGITANAVAPGFIDTEMVKSVPAKVAARIVESTAAKRMGRAEEVANVYLFLASDLASFMNGAVVGVDGGLLL